MPSVNELLQAETIRHLETLQRYSNGVLAKIIAVLNRSDKRLMVELAERLQNMDESSFSMERLESILTSLRAMSTAAYEQMGRELTQELRDFVAYEVSYQAQMLETHVPVGVHVAALNAEQVYAAAVARPFQGTLLRNVWPELEAGRMRRIRTAIAQGFVEGKTADQIVRELRGTKAKGYVDGLLQKDRRDVEAVVRTALGHMAAFTQNRSEQENADLIKSVRWSATLDNRTSAPCRLRDGKLYTPVDHKPIGHSLPWGAGPGAFHWRCRSARIPVLKSNEDLGIDIPEIVSVGQTRASMDGQVPADLSYGDWLKQQSAARQDEVLGPTRARLMRDGGMSMDQMYTNRGRALTLDEMREQDAAAFRKAGV